MLSAEDRWGNKLWTDRSGQVSLWLAGQPVRKIGVLTVSKDTGKATYYKTISMSKHLYAKTRSIGFCWELLDRLALDDRIAVYDKESGDTYTIPVVLAKDAGVGHFLHHKQQGFERQWFVPLAHFTKHGGKEDAADEDMHEVQADKA